MLKNSDGDPQLLQLKVLKTGYQDMVSPGLQALKQSIN